MDLEVIRNILVQAKTVGVQQTTADLKALSVGYEGVTVASQKTETATESVARKFQRLEGFLDPAARAARQLAKDISTLDQAFAQGGVSAERHAQLLNAATESAVRMSGGAAKATGVMEGFRQTMSGVSGQLLAMSAGAGPVGVFLSALGPWGIAAAVGLGAVSAAINHIVNEANRMGDKAIGMRQFSAATGLTAAEMKGIGKAAAGAGVDTETAVSAFERFTFALDETRKKSGTLFNEIREVSPALAEQISQARTTAEAIDVLAQAYKQAASESQRMAIARAAFGRGGSMAGLALPAIADAGGVNNIKAVTEATDAQIKSRSELRAETKRLDSETKNLYATMGTDAVLKAENDLAKFNNQVARLAVEVSKGKDDLTWFQNFMLGVSSLGGGGRTEEQLNAIKKLQEAARAQRGQDVTPNRHSQWEAQQLQMEMGVTPAELQSYIDLAKAKEQAAAATQRLREAAQGEANAAKERIGLLGEAATAEEKRLAQLAALKAAFLEGKFGVQTSAKALDDYRRAVDAVNTSARALTATHDAAIQTLQARTAAEREAAAAATVRAGGGGDVEVRAQQAVTMEIQKQVAAHNDAMDAMRGQLAVAQAVTGAEKIKAQYAATYAELIRQGRTQQQAAAEAAMQMAIAQAAATSSVEQSITGLNQQLEVLRASTQEQKDMVLARQAYDNAVASGADAEAARRLQAATEAISEEKRRQAEETQRLNALEQQRLAVLKQQNAEEEKYMRQIEDIYNGTNRLINAMNFDVGKPGEAGSSTTSRGPNLPVGYINQGGRIIMDVPGTYVRVGDEERQRQVDQQRSAQTQTLVDQFEMRRVEAQIAGSKSGEISAVQDELAFYKSQPKTLENLNQIKSLQDTLKQLTDATKDNTQSQNALSGLYSRQFGQGFYDGGAAVGELIYGLDNNTSGAIEDMQKAANDNSKTQNDLLKDLSQRQISSFSYMGGGIVSATENVQSELRSGFANVVLAVKTPAGTTPSSPSGTSPPSTSWPLLSPPPPHILGFARGGSFTTAGYGGDDTNVVAFRVSPQRERVTITPVAGSGNAGGGNVVHQYNDISINMPQNTDEFRSSAMQVADEIFNQVAIAGRRK